MLRSAYQGELRCQSCCTETEEMADEQTVKKIEDGYQTLKGSDSHSLLKKYLTADVVEKLKGRKTQLGATLWDVIQSGVKNVDSGVGVYAPDAESYTTFKELFDPIIEDYHGGFKPTDRQPPTDLGQSRVAELTDLDPQGKYILSTRIRCGRSLAGFPFNPCLTEQNYRDMEGKVKGIFERITDPELQGTYYPLTGMSKDVQQQLIADHFLFKEGDRFLREANACRYWPTGRGIFHNKDKTFLVWANEEDHLRIISMQAGGHVGRVLDRLIRGVQMIEKQAPFSRHDRLGWLTFCPTNLGTTVRASVHIKIPKVSSRPDFKQICDQMKLQIRVSIVINNTMCAVRRPTFPNKIKERKRKKGYRFDLDSWWIIVESSRMSFPSSLTAEELELKSVFEMLKRIKKLAQNAKATLGTGVKGDGDAGKHSRKRNLDEIAGATEEAKRLVKAGAMTIAKVEEKQTFKRSKQLDRRLKESDRECGVKYQPFNASSYCGDYSEDMLREDMEQRTYDRFAGGDTRPQRGTTVYVRGYDLMEDPLRKAFNNFGSIVRVHVEERRRSAFVEYSCNEEADGAIKEMNGNMLNGITLRVTMARRQNYVFRRTGDDSDRHNGQSAPDWWSSIASGRGESGEPSRDEGRGMVSYEDTEQQ